MNIISDQDSSTFILDKTSLNPDYEFATSNFKVFLWGSLYGFIDSERLVNNNLKEFEKNITELSLSEETINVIVNSLEGHFIALASSENESFIFGDKFGRKDLFYLLEGNSLIASTSLEFISSNKNISQFNQNSLVSMFSVYGNYCPKKETIYKDVLRLGVGELFVIKKGQINLNSLPLEFKDSLPEEKSSVEDYSSRLHDAVLCRASDSMNWVLLSSGWDSSSLLSLLVKLKGKDKVRALIARFAYSEESGVNNEFEVSRAEDIAEFFGVKIDILDIDYRKSDFVEYWEQIKHPLKANHLYVSTNFNYMKLAEHIKKEGSNEDSVFNGETSDGAHSLGFSQFATVLEHPDLSFREYSDKMASYLYGPTFLNCLLDGSYENDFVYNSLKSRYSGFDFKDIKGSSSIDIKRNFLETFFTQNLRFPLLSPKYSEVLTEKGVEEYISDVNENYFEGILESFSSENLYSVFLSLYNSFHWQGGTVKGFTHASNHYGLSSEMPFWDSRVQDFLSTMPESMGRGLDIRPTKYVLKEALKSNNNYPFHLQVGPHSYLYDINPDWSADGDILFGSSGVSYFKDILNQKSYEDILDESFFNFTYLSSIVDEYKSGIVFTGQKRTDLKNLLSLVLVGWY